MVTPCGRRRLLLAPRRPDTRTPSSTSHVAQPPARAPARPSARPPQAIDLLEKLLVLDPKRRIDAITAATVGGSLRAPPPRELARLGLAPPHGLAGWGRGPRSTRRLPGALLLSSAECKGLAGKGAAALWRSRLALFFSWRCRLEACWSTEYARHARPLPLQHSWFYSEPHPCKPEHLPRFEESHEMNMKKRRHEAAAQQGRQQKQRTDGAWPGGRGHRRRAGCGLV